MEDHSIFPLGDVALQNGDVLGRAYIAYKTFGALDSQGGNCIVLPTYYTGTHHSYDDLIGPGRALDPERFFIVIPDMFGNGLSSSPSLLDDPQRRALFPKISVADNVLCQHRLIAGHLGVKKIVLAAGWSMGGIQAFHWAAMFPDMVEALLPWCATARCWPLNRVFLEGARAALETDPVFAGGAYLTPPVAGLKAFGRVYAGWAYSAAFFRDALYRDLGAETLEEFLVAWEDEHLAWDANDLLAMLWTWAHADIGDIPGADGNYAAALSAIRARTLLMPCDRDSYFTVEEAEMEARHIAGAEVRPFHSAYGHCAGAPGRFTSDMDFLETALRELLA